MISFLLVYSLAYSPLFFVNNGLLRLLMVIIISSLSFMGIVWTIGLNKDERITLHELVSSSIIKSPFFKKLLYKN